MDARAWVRFEAKFQPEPTTGCWLWTGAKTPNGYGQFHLGDRLVTAHRASFEHHVGPVPDGLELDHVRARGCATRACVNPDHLEVVTRRENILRGDAAARRRATTKAVCSRGHDRTDSYNRQCRECRRQLHAVRESRPDVKAANAERMRERRSLLRLVTVVEDLRVRAQALTAAQRLELLRLARARAA